MSATPLSTHVPPIPEDIRTGIHCGDEHELGRERNAAGRAGYGDFAILEGLSHDLEGGAFELWQLIEKEDAVMRETDFAGLGNGGAAEQTDIGDGVMRRTERARGDERLFAAEHPGDAMDLGALDGFLERHRRHDGGDPFRQHRFAGTGRANHEHMIA
jgi:hypothetical protein